MDIGNLRKKNSGKEWQELKKQCLVPDRWVGPKEMIEVMTEIIIKRH